MSFYLTFVRHGQTPCNIGGIIQGSTGGELTERGKEMATCLGRLLAEEKERFTRIYSSDLNRCVQTTAHVLEKLETDDVPAVVYSEKLRERDYGDWEGGSTATGPFVETIKEMELGPYEHHKIEVPNGESYQETRERALNFFKEEILKLNDQRNDNSDDDKSENVLVVSHGIFLVCFLEELIRRRDEFALENFDEELFRKTRPENTCRTRFRISKPGPDGKRTLTFTHFYDTQHYKYLKEN